MDLALADKRVRFTDNDPVGNYLTVLSALPRTAEFEIRQEELAAAEVSECALARAAAT